MLFGDAPRNAKITTSKKSRDIGAHTKGNLTETHLGPGAYFTSHNENIRAGWVKRSFSTKQPMSPNFEGRKERHKSYTDSVMSNKNNGLCATGGYDSNSTPGPGHYNTYNEVMPLKRSPRAPFDPEQSSRLSPHGGINSGSPRVLHPTASLKNGVLFQGKAEEHATIGPGHYYNAQVDDKQLLKKSFNVRVSNGNSPRGRRSTSPGGRSRSASPDHVFRGSPNSHTGMGYREGRAEPVDYMTGVEAQTPAQGTPFHE